MIKGPNKFRLCTIEYSDEGKDYSIVKVWNWETLIKNTHKFAFVNSSIIKQHLDLLSHRLITYKIASQGLTIERQHENMEIDNDPLAL